MPLEDKLALIKVGYGIYSKPFREALGPDTENAHIKFNAKDIQPDQINMVGFFWYLVKNDF